jgi:hypothetical protein
MIPKMFEIVLFGEAAKQLISSADSPLIPACLFKDFDQQHDSVKPL